MMITFAYALSIIQYKRDHDTMIRLNKELHQVNAHLEEEVIKRTREIEDERVKRAVIEYSLAEKEKEVLKLLALGKKYKEIALFLFISESTVKSHIQRIYKKADCTNRVDLLKKIKLL